MKLENILVNGTIRSNHPHLHVVVADFSVSTVDEQFCDGVRGTLYTMAPEVLKTIRFDAYKADMWSLGVVYFMFLHHLEPFHTGSKLLQLTQ